MNRETYLSYKQMLFVEHYIQTGGNGTTAAREAGYKGKPATLGAVAYENLNKPHIRDEIKRRQEEIQERLEVSTETKRQFLWNTAKQCAMTKEVSRTIEVEETPNGVVIKTIHSRHALFDPAAAIKAIRELNRMDGDYHRCLGCPYR